MQAEGKASQHESRIKLIERQLIDVCDSVGKWSEAEVLEVDNGRVLVHYCYWQSKWDEWLPEESDRIAARGSQVFLENGTLRIDQRIDVCDEVSKWREAFVIDERQTQIKVHYKGWKDTFDEWIDRDSDRISPYGRHTKQELHKQMLSRQAEINRQKHRTRAIFAHCYKVYEKTLAKHDITIQQIDGDGNCLFRSVSHQVYGDDSHHGLVRAKCMEYMEVEKAYFQDFVVGDEASFINYISEKKRDGVWGDDPEIQAMCELYGRPAEVWTFDQKVGAQMLRSHSSNSSLPPMRLSFYGGGHYNALIKAGDFESALLRTEPGVKENSVIGERRAQLRSSTCQGLIGSEETDMIIVQAALKASREEFDCQYDNLEDKLVASLQRFTQDQAEDKDMKVATANSELIAVQEEMLESIQKQSEEEQVQQAIQASSNDDLEAAQLQHALQMSKSIKEASALESIPTEEEQMRAALQESLSNNEQQAEDPELAAVLAMSMNEFTAVPSFNGRQAQAEEDELQRVLQESLSLDEN